MAMNTNNTKPNTNSTLITNVLNSGVSEYNRSTLQTSIIKEKLFKDFLFVTSELYKCTTHTSGVGKTRLGE